MHKSIHSSWSVVNWLHFEEFWEVSVVVMKNLLWPYGELRSAEETGILIWSLKMLVLQMGLLSIKSGTVVWYFVTKIVLTYCEKKMFYLSRKPFEIRGWRLRICKNFEIIRTIYSNSAQWSSLVLQGHFWILINFFKPEFDGL